MTRYAIALGSNLGDRIHNLRVAVEAIAENGEVEALSRLYETEPVGGPVQDPYLNAVLVLRSDREPMNLLSELQRIEAELGRERLERWGPRTLDLDIVASDGPVVDDPPKLEVPHPRAAERRFVLAPLNDVWPDAMVGPDETAREAIAGVRDQKVDSLGPNWHQSDRMRPGTLWVGGQMSLFALLAVALVIGGELPSSILKPTALVGLMMVSAGVLLGGTASVSLGRGLTPLPEPIVGATLVVTGPFRWVRHPIYGGVILIGGGSAVLFSSRFGMLVAGALLIFFFLKTNYEERQLRIAYAGYSAYMSNVRYRFFPYVV